MGRLPKKGHHRNVDIRHPDVKCSSFGNRDERLFNFPVAPAIELQRCHSHGAERDVELLPMFIRMVDDPQQNNPGFDIESVHYLES